MLNRMGLSRMCLGLRTGHLVAESDLSGLECQKREGDRYENHPGLVIKRPRPLLQQTVDSVSLTT